MKKDDYSGETALAYSTMALRTMNFQFHYQEISKIVDSTLKKHNITLKEEVIDDLTIQIAEYCVDK